MATTHHVTARSAPYAIASGGTRSAVAEFAPAALGIALVLALCAALRALLGPVAFAESGPIETASALGYGASALVCAASAFRPGTPREGFPSRASTLDRLAGAALLAVLCARELDMHQASPIGSLTRSASYVNPDVPLGWRLLTALVVLGMVAAAAAFAWRTLRRWQRGELTLDRRMASVLAAIATLGVAKGIDGIGRKLGDVGVAVGPRFEAAAMGLEESLELAAPLVLLAVTLAMLVRPTRARPD